MFEREAEKWTIDYVCKDCSRYKECKSKEHCTCKNCSKEKWQNGAEFGYNKAKEDAKKIIEDLVDFLAFLEGEQVAGILAVKRAKQFLKR